MDNNLGIDTRKLAVRLYSKYGTLGPSSRLRMFQYLSRLSAHGIYVTAKPLFPDRYLRAIYGQHKAFGKISSGFHFPNRFASLLSRRRWDVTWIEGELLPYLPFMIEGILLRTHQPYIVDYDDALFHRYDRSGNFLVRGILGRKIDLVMSHAACVVAGNEYLADRARQAGARFVEIIPTVVDPSRYAKGERSGGHQVTIGWIGSPATETYLVDVAPLLVEVCNRYRARLLLVGATPSIASLFAGVDVKIEAWSEAGEASAVAEMDIGLMPLPDSDWARGKCGYKLIQYMACGVPFIASPVGVNVEIAKCGGGLLASSTEEWRTAFDKLLGDASLRSVMGDAGRQAVFDWYSVDVQAPRLATIFRSVALGREAPCAA